MRMQGLVFSMAAVFFAAMTGPALAGPGGHGGGPASGGPPLGAGNMSDRGGAVRGLDRADRVAGEHGDKGRDIAETRGNKGGKRRSLDRATDVAGEHGANGRAPKPAQEVMAAQQALKDKGHDPGKIDGKMGPRTRAMLSDYQKAKGLKVTGQLDNDTRGKLGL